MANINDLKPIQNLKPFTKFCCSIGAIPTSYLVSLTYEEQLLWLCNYLQDTVIPTVNNNGGAVNELQELYVTLKNYVDNYFTNLDVQNEINNKLDEMASDGTLDKIINQEIFDEINNKIRQNSNNINSILNSHFKTTGFSIHLSFDDVSTCFINLKNNNYSSLFNEPFFKLLQSLHNTYNACFSLYVFTDSFYQLTNKYQSEFAQSSNWLKIGYHGKNENDNLLNASYLQAKELYSTFVQNTIRICGTSRIIDRVPRLANYIAPLSCISGLADAYTGIIGLLDADDSRISYNHNSTIVNYMNTHYEYFDNITNLFFIKSNFRLENAPNLTTKLNEILTSVRGTNRNVEIFTHEQYIYNGTSLSNTSKLIEICSWANTNHIPFNFVENKLPNLSSNCLIAPYSKAMISLYQKNYNYYDNVLITNTSIGHLKIGLNPPHNIGGFQFNNMNNRAGINTILIAPTSHTIELHSLYPIQYTLFEYSNHIINIDNLIQSSPDWIDANAGTTTLTLNPNTQFYTICFKKQDNSEITEADCNANNIYVIPI